MSTHALDSTTLRTSDAKRLLKLLRITAGSGNGRSRTTDLQPVESWERQLSSWYTSTELVYSKVTSQEHTVETTVIRMKQAKCTW